jgi:DNA-binding response OmpR family regulator
MPAQQAKRAVPSRKLPVRRNGTADHVSPRRRILLIDDDAAMRRMIRHRLERNHEIIDTGDATEALALALEHKPDCILLDLSMPLFSGLELCQTFCSLSHTRMIPIFVITGQSASDHKEACLNLGAAEFFQKPLDFQRLNDSLAKLPSKEQEVKRGEVRVQLKVALKLAGTQANGTAFELLTSTDNVSVSGFTCRCPMALKENSILEVFQVGAKGERLVGSARLVHTEWAGLPWQICGFVFTSKQGPWIL